MRTVSTACLSRRAFRNTRDRAAVTYSSRSSSITLALVVRRQTAARGRPKRIAGSTGFFFFFCRQRSPGPDTGSQPRMTTTRSPAEAPARSSYLDPIRRASSPHDRRWFCQMRQRGCWKGDRAETSIAQARARSWPAAAPLRRRHPRVRPKRVARFLVRRPQETRVTGRTRTIRGELPRSSSGEAFRRARRQASPFFGTNRDRRGIR